MGLKVLSLFDGMSCGQLALQRLGIEVDTYYASEIDKYAIQVTQANFPKTIQIGDVTAWQTWDFDWSSIDLVTGGFPCQAWSLAGKQLGDKDERGKLFWTMLDVMSKVIEHNPKAFYLMENVKMKKEFEQYITYHTEQALPNVYKYLINSALVSAQNRQRYYWTNISGVEQPEDKGIVLRDILEDDVEDHYLAGKHLQNNYQGGNQLNPNYKSQANTIHDTNKKSGVICAGTHGYANGYVETKPKQVGLAIEKVKVRKHKVDILGLQNLLRTSKKESKKTNKQIANEIKIPVTKVEHWFRTDGSFAIPSDDIWLDLKEILNIDNNEFDKSIMEFDIRDGVYETTQRVYSQEGKSPTLTSAHAEKLVETKPKVVSGAWRGRYKEDGKTEQKLELNQSGKSNSLTTVQKDSVVVNEELSWRKLTPLECMRLQTVPDDYLMPVSNTQKYKLLGNGMTVDVIAHILNNMKL